MNTPQKIELFRAMLTAREIDHLEQALTSRGEAFFHVSGAGHEGSVCLIPHLRSEDFLHCHYRDKALMVARGIGPRAFFDSLFCKAASHSQGRQMSAHMSDTELNVLSIVGPVGNSALQAVGVAAAIKNDPSDPLVVCSVGDGTTQEGEFLEAVAEAVRSDLPVLFFVENNKLAISTRTEHNTFFSHPDGPADSFYGLPIVYINGRDVVESEAQIGPVIDSIRQTRRPALVVFEVERLTSHTNADDQLIYRDQDEIEKVQSTCDPITIFQQHLLDVGVTDAQIESIRSEVVKSVHDSECESAADVDPLPSPTAKDVVPAELTHPSKEVRGDNSRAELSMKDAVNAVLRHHMQRDQRINLFGEDIEDPKGDVFGVTRGLSIDFPGRVKNSALSESTIVGVSIGRALAGERPVAFIQFADFLPLAYNQIVSELGSMFWRTNGDWKSPVIIMVPCGGYRPGLGPFHAQSFESLIAHTPGIDVFMPSTACDAAGLLNAAFASERPTVFFYPKSCLNDPTSMTSPDVETQLVPIGTARKVRAGKELTMVGWGNTVRLCERAAEQLDMIGIESEIFDLRSLSPWDEKSILASVEKTANLIVVHEDNQTCGMGSEILATVVEKSRVPVAMRRVTRPDTYVPCNFSNQIEVLPSYKRILTTAAEMLDLDLTWIQPEAEEQGIGFIEAIGSGPSDETVDVVELYVKEGDKVQRGQAVASLEATKSVFDLTSPISGTIDEILIHEGDKIDVGQRMIKVLTGSETTRPKPITQEQPGTPLLRRRNSRERLRVPRHHTEIRRFDVGVSNIASTQGSQLITNDDLVKAAIESQRRHGSGEFLSSTDILRRTGIQHRHWAGKNEDAVSMAVDASWKVLDQEGLIPDDLDLVVCCTTSPTSVTPSMACQIMRGLSSGKTDAMVQAYDINAACSGYLYALQAGYDYLQSQPDGRVLVVTAEVLSPLLDPADFDTAIIFGDAASATVLYGEEYFASSTARLYRPELSAKCDDDDALSVPLLHDGFIQMKGRRVFTEAVRSMVSSLNRVCSREGIQVDELDLVVPHQANQRIIDAVQSRIRPEVYSNIIRYGNTSSTSIPLCLSELIPRRSSGDRLGLCAFGGGFTFGASIIQWN